ncbi:uncharacterized protein BXZ73DRAFT_76408 [Epithele typhae]|uniref:uncharacterized protein n=1 Tax=Epithele typhae TaxID=378194 RepID=UPI002007839B|nr:uncharacterized protein BXZ73DRAFT_76408 [Epithele typhae]KAH9937756.1 hypothetical protein BXZ73DRAFT_76408 [Epithele typhae]
MIHKLYEVWITCDGKPLPEYSVRPQGSDGRLATCYIPSESGKNFAIHWHDRAATDDLSLLFDIDGQRLSVGKLCRAGRWGRKAGIVTAAGARAFMFSELMTTGPIHRDLGSIRVNLTRVRSNASQVDFLSEQFAGVGPVHERSKMSGTHGVGLGHVHSPRTVAKRKHVKAPKPVDPSEGCIAVFVFNYRPYAVLQAQGIVPLMTHFPSRPLSVEDDTPVPDLVEVKKRSCSPDLRTVIKRFQEKDEYSTSSDEQDLILSPAKAKASESDDELEALQASLRSLRAPIKSDRGSA